MKRIIILISIVLLLASQGHTFVGAIAKKVKDLLGDDIQNIANQVNNNQDHSNKEFGNIKDLIGDIKIQADAEANAQIAYKAEQKKMRDEIHQMMNTINKTVTDNSNNIKTISKNVNQQNQAGIFYVGFIIMGIIMVCLMFGCGYLLSLKSSNKAYIESLRKSKDFYKGKAEGVKA